VKFCKMSSWAKSILRAFRTGIAWNVNLEDPHLDRFFPNKEIPKRMVYTRK
jgi:hypothetical protein